MNEALGYGEVQGTALTQLALTTLGSFDFGGNNLLDLLRECISGYIDSDDKATRQAAALAAARVGAAACQFVWCSTSIVSMDLGSCILVGSFDWDSSQTM